LNNDKSKLHSYKLYFSPRNSGKKFGKQSKAATLACCSVEKRIYPFTTNATLSLWNKTAWNTQSAGTPPFGRHIGDQRNCSEF